MKWIRNILNFLNLSVSLTVIGSLIWFHGYKYNPESVSSHIILIHTCLSFYIIQFLTRAFISGDFKDYLETNKFEFLLFIFIVFEIVSNGIIKFSFLQLFISFSGLTNPNQIFILSIHILLLIIVGIELGKATTRSTIWKLSPPILFIISFIVLIVIGCSLLMLPEITSSNKSMPFIDALFTSISANCVTGLIVQDTATYFSLKGKVLLLILIQLGGLNIIAFATYFISFYRKKLNEERHRSTIKEILHTDNLDHSKNMIKKVIYSSFVIEFIGSLILYYQFNGLFKSNLEQWFYSLFHSVSAFNNAGFSLFTDGFNNNLVNHLYPSHITIACLIILGGLGFTVLQDIFNSTLFKKIILREPFNFPIQTKIALISSFILIVFGMTIFYFLENDNVLKGLHSNKQLITSFFQSVTTRTAGFNTVNISQLHIPTLWMMIFLMFIGASSGSTGGGIKTSTFSVLLLGLFKKNIDKDYKFEFITKALYKKAKAITLYSLIVISISIILLLFTEENQTFTSLAFEAFSAFGTVGLTTGITPSLSDYGKIIIMTSMFIGRIGPLALAYAIIKKIHLSEEIKENGLMLG
ncbi:MAG: hypothetical protein Kow0079_08400 [Vicingaceae bacterium]